MEDIERGGAVASGDVAGGDAMRWMGGGNPEDEVAGGAVLAARVVLWDSGLDVSWNEFRADEEGDEGLMGGAMVGGVDARGGAGVAKRSSQPEIDEATGEAEFGPDDDVADAGASKSSPESRSMADCFGAADGAMRARNDDDDVLPCLLAW
jgi:hypothetical protein